MALAVASQVVNPRKGLLAFRTREMVFHRQMNHTVALKTVFPLESFATTARKDLNAQVDVFVTPQGSRVIEDNSTSSASVVNCSMEASLVHSQISRSAKLSCANITGKGIAVCVDFHVPPQLDCIPKLFATERTFVSDGSTVFHVFLQLCFRLKVLTAGLTLEMQLTIFPLLMRFQDFSSLESSSTDITLVAVYLRLLWRHLVQVKIDICLLVTHR